MELLKLAQHVVPLSQVTFPKHLPPMLVPNVPLNQEVVEHALMPLLKFALSAIPKVSTRPLM